jgi:hypothetical protein
MIRVFPRKTKWTPTDDLAFVGEPPLFRPMDQEKPVLISVTFTWDLPTARRLQQSWLRFYRDVRIGGPALDDPGDTFVPGRFVKTGVTFTSRGCPKRCPWCFAWRREGPIRLLPIIPGRIVQDSNLLACPKRHIQAVFDMLSNQHAVVFSGGLDATLFGDWHRKLLDKIHLEAVWFSCDTASAIPHLKRAAHICEGIPEEKRRCYALIGFGDESLADAERRLECIYELGFLPFAQLFRGENTNDWSPAWRALARKWARPAAYRIKKLKTETGAMYELSASLPASSR